MVAPNVIPSFISSYRDEVTSLLDVMQDTLAMKVQYDALNYTGTLIDANFNPDNSGITAQEFKDAVAAIEALRVTFDVQRTTLFKIKKV